MFEGFKQVYKKIKEGLSPPSAKEKDLLENIIKKKFDKFDEGFLNIRAFKSRKEVLDKLIERDDNILSFIKEHFAFSDKGYKVLFNGLNDFLDYIEKNKNEILESIESGEEYNELDDKKLDDRTKFAIDVISKVYFEYNMKPIFDIIDNSISKVNVKNLKLKLKEEWGPQWVECYCRMSYFLRKSNKVRFDDAQRFYILILERIYNQMRNKIEKEDPNILSKLVDFEKDFKMSDYEYRKDVREITLECLNILREEKILNFD